MVFRFKFATALVLTMVCVQKSRTADLRDHYALTNEAIKDQPESLIQIIPNAAPTYKNVLENSSYESLASLDDISQKHLKRITPIMFAHPRAEINTTETCSSSMDEFPNLFSEEQLRDGGIVLAFAIGIYCFTLLAIICDSYFLPCVERICEALNLSQDVAAATFMSVATSAPELFVNIIGTFLTQSDIGIGTVVGSSMFNTLGVASLGGLAASTPIQMDWWPVTRDVILYIMAIILLVAMTWDGLIFWYEGLVLFIAYFLYFSIMFQNDRISKHVRRWTSKFTNKGENLKNNITVAETIDKNMHLNYTDEPKKIYIEYQEESKKEEVEEEEPYSFRKLPKGSIWKKLFYIYTYPIKLILFCTIPDPKVYPKLFPISFIICIIWIGSNSYVVSWMITIIGFLFGIPDAVLGLTFLAAGGCLPESISLVIMSRKGEGRMGVSNALGANTMNILLSLGMPWFIKTILMGANSKSFIEIDSGSIEYTILALILVALILYTTLTINKFRLSRKMGCVLLAIYLICIMLAILSEMVFFESAQCDLL